MTEEKNLPPLTEINSETELHYRNDDGDLVPVRLKAQNDNTSVFEKVFGSDMANFRQAMNFESNVFGYMDRTFQDYNGGQFDMLISDDNQFMCMLLQGKTFKVEMPYTGEIKEISSLAASVAACKFVASNLGFLIEAKYPQAVKAKEACIRIYHGMADIWERLPEDERTIIYALTD